MDVFAYAKRKARAEGLLDKDEEARLLAEAKAGSAEARAELVERNLLLAVKAAKKYAAISGIPFDDLMQEGAIGITIAVDMYDPGMKTRFSTYACRWIQQKVGRYAKKHGKNVKTPEHVVNLASQARREAARLAASGENTDPSPSDLADAVFKATGRRHSPAEVAEALEAVLPETSIYSPVGEDGGELVDLLPDEKAADPEACVARAEAQSALLEATKALDPLQQAAVELLCGVSCAEPADRARWMAEAFHMAEDEARAALKKRFPAPAAV